MDSQPPPLSFKQVLAIPEVRRLWTAQLISVFGDFLAIFAVFTVATYQYHANAVQISYLLVAYMLPLAVVSPLAGVLVDRWNRRTTMIVSDLLRAAIAVALLFSTSLNQIYLIFFCLSVVSSFFIPAQSVTIRNLVPQHGLVAANALMAQAMQVTQILTPAFAGWLVATTGAAFCYWVDILSFLASAALVASLPDTPAGVRHRLSGVLREMGAGLHFIFTHSALGFVMLAMTAAMFAVRCFGALFAVYARDILRAGPEVFGALNSLVGVGMIIGTQTITRAARNRRKPDLVVFGLLAGGLFISLLAFSANLAGAIAGMLGLGIGVAFIFIPTQTLLQEVTPIDMLGRVSSAMMSALAFTQTIALVVAGSAATRVGITNVYYASAALLAALGLLGYRGIAASRPAAAASQP